MPIPLALASAGISAIPSLIKSVSGIFQIGKGNRLARENVRPIEQVNENIAKNAAMAEQMAGVGLPQEQFNVINQGIQRNQTGGYRALGRSSNPSAGLASLVRAGNDATLNLGAQDANARMQNQRFSFGQRSALAQEQNRVFDWNKRQKYLEQAQAAAALQGAGRQNLFGGASDLAQIGSSYLNTTGGGNSTTQDQYPQGGFVPFGTTYNRFNNTSNRAY